MRTVHTRESKGIGLSLLLFSALVWTVQAAPGPPALRLHHLHVQAGDPAAALNASAGRLGGTRTLLQGFGVGVRVGDEYLLFDRLPRASAAAPAPVRNVADAYARTVRWLAARGLAVSPGSFADSPLSNMASAERLDHIGFVPGDFAGASTALRSAGAEELARTETSVMFRIPGGDRLELVKGSGEDDSYWCPMHLDIRSPRPGTCPLCGMDLVPIPPPRIGEYRLDVDVVPAANGAGSDALRFAVRDPATSEIAEDFATVHERRFHLFIISRDLHYFAHEHPEQVQDGSFELRHPLAPGEYTVIADVLPVGGTSQMLQRVIVTPGYSGPLFTAPPRIEPGPPEYTADGLRITLDAGGAAAGKEARLRFAFADAATGAPVRDLQPFLGAAAHLLIVNADVTEAIHSHPEGQATSPRYGPSIAFEPLIPAPGMYKLWIQVQRSGRVITAPFVIAVR